MKRKIAVLLSAMMVASAMPMTASAVQLKSDSIVNAGFGKVGSTIDAKAGEYKNYTTADQLKSRESVLKVALNDDGTGTIPKSDSSFKLILENGTFGDLEAGALQEKISNAGFAYKNISDGSSYYLVNGKAQKVPQNYIGQANTGSVDGSTEVTIPDGAFAVENGVITGVVQGGKIVPVADNKESKALVDALNALLTKLAGVTNNATTTPGSNQLKDGSAAEMAKLLTSSWSEGTSQANAVAAALKACYLTESDDTQQYLPHIPYKMEILSSTEAKITSEVDITDKMRDLGDNGTSCVGIKEKSSGVMAFDGTGSTGKLSIEVYKKGTADSNKGIIPNTGTDVANVAKETTSGGTGGYILLCDETKNNAPTANLIGDTTKKMVEVSNKNLYFALPLGGVKVNGNGPVKVKVEADYSTRIKGGEYTITKATGEGSTSLVYPTSSVKSFDESLSLDQVTIKENSRGTIGDVANGTATFTLKVNSGFKFDNAGNNSSVNGVTVTDASGRNANLTTTAKYVGDGQNTIEVSVSGLTNRDGVIGLSVKGLKVAPLNSKNFGDIELTVSGNGIDSKTIKVAKREAIGFKLETAKQAKEIVAGRSYEKDTVNMNLQDSQTVEVKFSELVAGSLISSRSLDFNLPEGVKIVDAELSEVRNMNNLAKDDFEIINNGKTLRLKPNGYTVNSNAGKNLASFKLKFELSVAPDFAGDVKCTVTGGGQGSDAKVETVIAKAIAPFKIETKNTKINLGYQDYNTADIVITEAKPGMFLQNKEVVIGLKAPFKGGNTIGFSQASYEVSGGELEVKDKDFKVENDVIKFKVNRNSTKNPSTITIKNVKIGTNRSVPFGSYNLTVAGDAVLNNYSATKDKNGVVQVSNDDKNYNLSSLTSTDKKQLANQDRTEYFEIKDYVNVVTETGTFNETVKVSVGEKTVVVGGQTLDMDVAPYIQASSNSTMVPLRFVAVALGVDSANVANPDQSSKVAWDQNSKTVTIYYGAGTGQKIIQFQAGSNVMTVDGTRIPMEYGVKAEIKEGRMFVPFRALGQALGVSVSWDPETRTAIYNAENARNANVTTTTTKETTTATTTATTTTKKEDSTTSTTKAESTTETTTAAAKK